MEDRRPHTEDLQDTCKSPGLKPGHSGKKPCDRSRKAEWDAREMRTATTKLRREDYEKFKILCEERQRTPYEVLKMLLLAWMRHAYETKDVSGFMENGKEVMVEKKEYMMKVQTNNQDISKTKRLKLRTAEELRPRFTGWHSSGGGD